MKHACSALVLHCIDFRFGKALKEELERRSLLGDCDIVALAGAARNIADPAEPADASFALRQIEIAKRLHEIGRVVLVNHTDCGAYGGRSAFASDEEERERHAADMERAASLIKAAYPGLAVEPLLARIHGDGSVTFESC